VGLFSDEESNASSVRPLGDHADISNFKLDGIGDLVFLEVEFNGVTILDFRVWVANCSTVVCDYHRDSASLPCLERVASNACLFAFELLHNLKELELGLSSINFLENEASLHIV